MSAPHQQYVIKTGWRLRWWLAVFLAITYFKWALVHCPLDLWCCSTLSKLQCGVNVTITYVLRRQKIAVILFTVILTLSKQFGPNLQHLQAVPIHALEISMPWYIAQGFPGTTRGKASTWVQVDTRLLGSTRGLGRSPEGEQGGPLQNSCLENPMDRGARWAAVHQSQSQPKRLSAHRCTS